MAGKQSMCDEIIERRLKNRGAQVEEKDSAPKWNFCVVVFVV